jgi:HKD family nuclease
MEPQLVYELLEEMRSADAVDILVSFIKWSGLHLLMPGFEDLRDRRVPVRVITTSYMGDLGCTGRRVAGKPPAQRADPGIL